MAATGKSLIPIELLRRSKRLKRSLPTLACDQDLLKVDKKVPQSQLKARGGNKTNLNDNQVAGANVSAIKIERLNEEDKLACPVKLESVIKRDEQLDGFDNYSIDIKPSISTDNALKPDGCLSVDSDELDLERTLMGGQSFRWKKFEIPRHNDKGACDTESRLAFQGVIGNNALQLWRLDGNQIAFRKLNNEGVQGEDLKSLLEDYFQLKYKLRELYSDWSMRDKHFSECSKFYIGFRILRQHPVENVFSFICATNNNIKRISQMIDKMCCRFGDILETRSDNYDDDDNNKDSQVSINDKYYTFPTAERMARDDVFDCLRYDLGFGYRAKFICETAKKLLSLSKNCDQSPGDYLLSLRNLPYKDTCKQLQAFPGIGRKVADCICLMSMDHLESVPIDCHIYEIVCRNYMPNLRQERKTLTESVHDLIGSYFTDLHGPLAGWATSVLFIAELKHLKQQQQQQQKQTKHK